MLATCLTMVNGSFTFFVLFLTFDTVTMYVENREFEAINLKKKIASLNEFFSSQKKGINDHIHIWGEAPVTQEFFLFPFSVTHNFL
jgi:hypothetical protein